jgi:hypothetical protein
MLGFMFEHCLEKLAIMSILRVGKKKAGKDGSLAACLPRQIRVKGCEGIEWLMANQMVSVTLHWFSF